MHMREPGDAVCCFCFLRLVNKTEFNAFAFIPTLAMFRIQARAKSSATKQRTRM